MQTNTRVNSIPAGPVGATPGVVVAPGTEGVVPAGGPTPGAVVAPGTGAVVAAGGPVPTPGVPVAPGTGAVVAAGGPVPTPGAVVAPGTGPVVPAGGPTPGALVAPGTGAVVPAGGVVTVKYHCTDDVLIIIFQCVQNIDKILSSSAGEYYPQNRISAKSRYPYITYLVSNTL